MTVEVLQSRVLQSQPRPKTAGGSLSLGRTSSLPEEHCLTKTGPEEGTDSQGRAVPIRRGAPHGGPGGKPKASATPNRGHAALSLRLGPALATEAGGTTKLHLSLDCVTGRMVAVKQVASASAQREIRELERERAALERLKGCPNVVQLLGASSAACDGDGSTKMSLVLEYVSGGSLMDIMSRFGGALPEPVVRRYARGILQGLASVHGTGTVHCSLKAANVLVCGGTGAVKLTGFGTAVREDEAAMQCAGGQHLPMNFDQWMAPEVVRQESLTPAADVWSFGCTLLEMLTGGVPWAAQVGAQSSLATVIGWSQSLPYIPSHLSSDCQKLLRRCLAREVSQRPTALQLLQDPFLLPGPTSWKEAQGSAGTQKRGSWAEAQGLSLTASLDGRGRPNRRSDAALGLDTAPNGLGSGKAPPRLPPSASLDAMGPRPKSRGRGAQGQALQGGAPLLVMARPESPGGHHGLCQETLQQALEEPWSGSGVALEEPCGGCGGALEEPWGSSGRSSSVEIWQRDEEAGEGEEEGAQKLLAEPGDGLKAAQKAMPRHQSLPSRASLPQRQAAQPLPPQPLRVRAGQQGMPQGLAPSPQAYATGAMPSNVPPVSQLLNPLPGVKMGPLMRQISRDALEFARLHQNKQDGMQQHTPGATPNSGLPATLGAPVSSAVVYRTPKSNLDAARQAGLVSPAGPLSPGTFSPSASSPVRVHRRSASMSGECSPQPPLRIASDSQADRAPPAGPSNGSRMAPRHRRSGSVHFESSVSAGPAPGCPP